MTATILILVALLLTTCIFLFIVDWYINMRLKGKLPVQDVPTAVGILKVTAYFVAALMVIQMINPLQAVAKVLPVTQADRGFFVGFAGYYSLFLGLMLIATFILFWLSGICWSIFTKGRKIYYEVASNNVVMAVLFCGIFLALALVANIGLPQLLDLFVPYPEVPAYTGLPATSQK